jgi:hypothetical protein
MRAATLRHQTLGYYTQSWPVQCAISTVVGMAVGAAVGSSVGAAVGSGVGSLVGEAVGSCKRQTQGGTSETGGKDSEATVHSRSWAPPWAPPWGMPWARRSATRWAPPSESARGSASPDW